MRLNSQIEAASGRLSGYIGSWKIYDQPEAALTDTDYHEPLYPCMIPLAWCGHDTAADVVARSFDFTKLKPVEVADERASTAFSRLKVRVEEFVDGQSVVERGRRSPTTSVVVAAGNTLNLCARASSASRLTPPLASCSSKG